MRPIGVTDQLVDVVVIGGGPAGSAAARLLARSGHSVVLLTRGHDASRGAAESLPPSTRKLLAQVGVLDRVDEAGFFRTTGNTVWWAAREGDVQTFGASDEAGYQVFRPDLDRLLLGAASDAGAEVFHDATAVRVALDDDGVRVEFQREGQPPASLDGRFALDCSGRAGVIARQGFRRPQPGYRTQALIGVWRRGDPWDLPDPTHTVVETYEDGWAWSVPVSDAIRQVGVVLDAATSTLRRGPTLESTYRGELAKTRQLSALASGGELERVWACDASLYSAHTYAPPSSLLVGDAGSCIDPLSSFGVKKALASAWVAAVAVRTCLRHPGRRSVAFRFFEEWERHVYTSNLARSREFSREAYGRHPHPFWAARAEVDIEPFDIDVDEEALLRASDVRAAFDALKGSHAIAFAPCDDMAVTDRPIIRDAEIVLEPAIVFPGAPRGVRHLGGIDLVALIEIACRHDDVGEMFEAYCRMQGAVSLPSLLGALSVLVAKGVLANHPTFS